jgi:hypothetical protein
VINNAKAHFGTIDIAVPNAGYEGKITSGSGYDS